MKVLYLINNTIDPSSGISKKIMSQCSAMLHFCKKVDLVSIAYHDLRFVDFLNDHKISIGLNSSIYGSLSKLSKILLKIKKVFSFINTDNFVESYDIIYIRRFIPLLPSYIYFLKKIKKNAKVYYEIPTYPYIQEHKELSVQNLLVLIFEHRSIERLKNVVDVFVVNTEIQDEKARNRLGEYKIIPNGFDVSSVHVRIAPLLANEIHILGLANLAFWHGYDRIVTGMAEYKGPYKIIFHLAGGSGTEEIEKIRILASKLDVIDNIVFHEPLFGDKLTEVFDICHVAAGALGGHRVGLHYTSELKLREYCARGIPFFMSCYDPDFENFDYALKVTEDDTPIDMACICNFAINANLDKKHVKLMNKFAKDHVDWTIILKQLFI